MVEGAGWMHQSYPLWATLALSRAHHHARSRPGHCLTIYTDAQPVHVV